MAKCEKFINALNEEFPGWELKSTRKKQQPDTEETGDTCEGSTKKGTRCRNKPGKESQTCWIHSN